MAASKRPSTSSLRRFITSRPYVTVAELRRRFGLDDPDAMACLALDGRHVYLGLPDREASKIEDLLARGEIGIEMSVEVRAPVAVGVYPMRIARYVTDGVMNGNGHPNGAHLPADLPDADDVVPLEPMPDATPAVAEQPGGTSPIGELPAIRPEEQATAEPTNGAAQTNGHPTNGAHSRDPRATRHNGRCVPRRRRRNRFHRPRPGPGSMPGDAPSQ